MLLQQDGSCKRLHLAVLAVVAITMLLATNVESFSVINSRSSSRSTTNYDRFHSSPVTTKSTMTNPTTSGHGSGGKRSALFMAGGKVDKGFNLLEIATKVVPQGRIVQTTLLLQLWLHYASPSSKVGVLAPSC